MRVVEWRSGVIVGFLLLVAFWLGSLIWGLAGKARIAITEAREAKEQYLALEARKVELDANLVALGTDRGHDAAIRTTFGVAREGEEVIVVIPPATIMPTTTPSWWEHVTGWFVWL